MKPNTIALLLLLHLLPFMPAATAQSVFESIMETAEMYNEDRSERESPELTEQQREYQRRWVEQWNREREEHQASLNGLGSYSRCVGLMVLYLSEYYKVADAAEAASNCKMKYDWYGMQLLALISSTTIMHCPEDISNLPNSLQRQAIKDFVTPHLTTDSDGNTVFDTSFWGHKLKSVYYRFAPHFYEDDPLLFMQWLWGHFYPENIVNQTFDIGQKMEALGCGG